MKGRLSASDNVPDLFAFLNPMNVSILSLVIDLAYDPAYTSLFYPKVLLKTYLVLGHLLWRWKEKETNTLTDTDSADILTNCSSFVSFLRLIGTWKWSSIGQRLYPKDLSCLIPCSWVFMMTLPGSPFAYFVTFSVTLSWCFNIFF